MTVAEGGGIFVSYRREETGPVAGRLYDRLADRFGKSHVFMSAVLLRALRLAGEAERLTSSQPQVIRDRGMATTIGLLDRCKSPLTAQIR